MFSSQKSFVILYDFGIKAQNKILNQPISLKKEKIAFVSSLKRVLAEKFAIGMCHLLIDQQWTAK